MMLAIDIGSTFLKSALLDLDRPGVAAIRSEPTPPRLPHANPRHYEIDLEALTASVSGVLAGRVAEGPPLSGVMLSTQTHGFVLTDARGTPLTQYVSWQDSRSLDPGPDGETYLAALRRVAGPELMAPSGIALKPGLALSSLATWLAHRRAEWPDGRGILFHTLGGYILYRLGGARVCHLTNAAATGMADIAARRWNRPLLEALGLGGIDMPGIVEGLGPVAVLSEGGLALHPDVGDHHATMLGCLLRPGEDVCVNVATAAQLTSIGDEIRRGPYEVRPYFEGRYLNTCTGIPGGRALDILVDFIAEVGATVFERKLSRGDVWRRIAGLVTADDRGLTVRTGFFEGTVGESEGAVQGIGPANLTTATLFAGAFRNMAETYARLMEQMEPNASRLVFAGTVARRNAALRQAVVRACGRPGVLAPFEDEVFVGLLRLALVESGRCENLAETETRLSGTGGNREGREE
jgi:sugar (pentulose or hexulose) kinase